MRKTNTKIIAGMVALLLTVGTAGASIITATGAGYLTNSATWGGTAVPLPGNTDTWQSGANLLYGGTGTFYGATLVIQTSGTLRMGIAGATGTLQNVTLDGGKISQQTSGTSSFKLNTLTLNSGRIESGNGASRAVNFVGGALAGSGTITIGNAGSTYTNLVSFNTALGSVTTTNFSGLFSVTSKGELGFSGGTTAASFGIDVANGGFLLLTDGTDTKVTSLTLGGVAKTAGTYSVTDLGAYSFTPTGTGTITVIPEPATIGMLGLGAIITLMIRRMRTR